VPAGDTYSRALRQCCIGAGLVLSYAFVVYTYFYGWSDAGPPHFGPSWGLALAVLVPLQLLELFVRAQLQYGARPDYTKLQSFPSAISGDTVQTEPLDPATGLPMENNLRPVETPDMLQQRLPTAVPEFRPLEIQSPLLVPPFAIAATDESNRPIATRTDVAAPTIGVAWPPLVGEAPLSGLPHLCPFCGRGLSGMPADTRFCGYCGKSWLE